MKKFFVKVNGVGYDVEIEEVTGNGVQMPVQQTLAPAPAAVAQKPVQAAPAAAPAAGEAVKAPLPGTVLDIRVSAGQSVKSGDIMLVLEAMKMENEILAPRDGVVAGVSAVKGASVNTGDILVTLK